MTDARAWLSVPREGETKNGDAVVIRSAGDWELFAVVDALGHGALAAEVASQAESYLAGAAPLTRGALEVMQGLHAHLRGSRGAAGLVCVASKDRIDACGVGNVELRAEGLRLPVLLTPGIIGANLKGLRAFGGELRGACRIVIHTDGVSPRFSLGEYRALPPSLACRAIFDLGRRAHDDATVLVADLGAGPS